MTVTASPVFLLDVAAGNHVARPRHRHVDDSTGVEADDGVAAHGIGDARCAQ